MLTWRNPGRKGGVYLNLGQRLVVYVTMGRHIRMLSLFWRSLARVLLEGVPKSYNVVQFANSNKAYSTELHDTEQWALRKRAAETVEFVLSRPSVRSGPPGMQMGYLRSRDGACLDSSLTTADIHI